MDVALSETKRQLAFVYLNNIIVLSPSSVDYIDHDRHVSAWLKGAKVAPLVENMNFFYGNII